MLLRPRMERRQQGEKHERQAREVDGVHGGDEGLGVRGAGLASGSREIAKQEGQQDAGQRDPEQEPNPKIVWTMPVAKPRYCAAPSR